MPIITDPKKLSMPQQVQKNKDDIEDIKKIIDGLDAEDNVVVVNDISQILTTEELEAIKQPVAFIVYNNHLYFKRKENSAIAYFDVVFSITASTVITLESSEIQVQLSNGALGIVNSTVSTYSETQIDNKLSLKADITYVDNNFASLSGANFIGPITAPSIIENMTGYTVSPLGTFTDLTVVRSYVGVAKNGNKLTVVIAGTLKRTGPSAPNPNILTLYMPRSVMDKLYRNNLGYLRNMTVYAFKNYYTSVPIPCIVSKASDYNITVNIYSLSGLELDVEYGFNIEFTFLLSDNLAQ